MGKTVLGSLRPRRLSFVALLAVGVVGFSAVAAADTLGSIDFESYDTGNIHDQHGWRSSGPYDLAVDHTLEPARLRSGVADLELCHEQRLRRPRLLAGSHRFGRRVGTGAVRGQLRLRDDVA